MQQALLVLLFLIVDRAGFSQNIEKLVAAPLSDFSEIAGKEFASASLDDYLKNRIRDKDINRLGIDKMRILIASASDAMVSGRLNDFDLKKLSPTRQALLILYVEQDLARINLAANSVDYKKAKKLNNRLAFFNSITVLNVFSIGTLISSTMVGNAFPLKELWEHPALYSSWLIVSGIVFNRTFEAIRKIHWQLKDMRFQAFQIMKRVTLLQEVVKKVLPDFKKNYENQKLKYDSAMVEALNREVESTYERLDLIGELTDCF